MKEEERIRSLKRKAVVEKQLAELHSLKKYEIKMLVRLDKEFSDVTYVPASSLAMQLSELCKKHNNTKFDEAEKRHSRPYYDYEEQVKLFDESSVSKIKAIETNPDLQKRLQAEIEQRKQIEQEHLA